MKVSCNYSDTTACKMCTGSFCDHHQVVYICSTHGFSVVLPSLASFLELLSREMGVEACHLNTSADVASFDVDQTGYSLDLGHYKSQLP